MASNPMQRKIRNAVLISVLITMIIMGAIGGLFAFKIYKKQKEEEATIKKVYILAKDMDAGESLIQSNVTILKLVDIDCYNTSKYGKINYK
jgi:Flp pilus assembly protein CpaB